MGLMKVAFDLEGVTPLLMHADNIEAADELVAWRKDPGNKNLSTPGDDRSPPWTWSTYLYTDGERVVMPADNLMANLRYAGTQVIMKRQKTFKEITQSGMMCDGEFLEFEYSKNKTLAIADVLKIKDDPKFSNHADWATNAGFRLFAKRARVGTNKHVRVRPRFDTWRVRGTLVVMATELTLDVLKQLFEIGGRGGMCDWRPNGKTPGSFGMYRATVKKVK